MEPLTRQQLRTVDRLAVEQLKMPSILLMENAGRGCAQIALAMLAGRREPVAVVCGPGNNGGDGFVIARHLHNASIPVRLWLTVSDDSYRGDARTNLQIIKCMKLEVRTLQADQQSAFHQQLMQAGLVVDAILGTGAHGPLRSPFDTLVRAINDSARPVLAVDIPTGLDCDTGLALSGDQSLVVRASATATFVAPKVGFEKPFARRFLGVLHVVDIGVPPQLVEQVRSTG